MQRLARGGVHARPLVRLLRPLCASLSSSVSDAQYGDMFARLARHSTPLPVNADSIRVLHSPSEFYSTLRDGIKTAQKRVVLAALYLGTTKHDTDLIKEIEGFANRTQHTGGSIRLLFDWTRGTRGQVNSATITHPLVQQFGHMCDVSLYHTPELRHIWKRILVPPFNEIISLTHVKIYIYDDTLLLSGANMSDHYYTNRQDRYVLITDAGVSEVYARIVDAISACSMQLHADASIRPRPGCDPLGDYGQFIEAMRGKMKPILDEISAGSQPANIASSDTHLFPLVQMGLFGIRQDEAATTDFLQNIPEYSSLRIASGYFNLTNEYMNALIASQGSCLVIAASPTANGFLGAKGPRGHVPSAYTYLEQLFLERVARAKQQFRIQLMEWSRQDWTFHVKGFWWIPCGSTKPALTFIGSPNFGYRSTRRDLEAQAVIMTTNPQLQEQLQQELQLIEKHSSIVTEDTFRQPHRVVKRWEKLATRIIQSFF
eukprot:m.634636 g.634636  ORF g.634636 m.634636 type:complete len:487 (+) comp58303_c0_seq7:2-1462(+)